MRLVDMMGWDVVHMVLTSSLGGPGYRLEYDGGVRSERGDVATRFSLSQNTKETRPTGGCPPCNAPRPADLLTLTSCESHGITLINVSGCGGGARREGPGNP